VTSFVSCDFVYFIRVHFCVFLLCVSCVYVRCVCSFCLILGDLRSLYVLFLLSL